MFGHRENSVRELCLDFMTAMEVSPPTLVEIAAENGIPFISLPIRVASDRPNWGLVGDTEMRRDTGRRCRELGVGVDILESFYIRPDCSIPALRPAFESGAWLGARRVVMVTQDEDAHRLTDNAGRFCDVATEYGFDVLLEYTPRMTQKTLAEARAFLDRVGHPRLSVEADALHTFRGGTPLAELAASPPGVIRRIQLCDAPAEEPPEGGLFEAVHARMVPGEGALDLHGFLAAAPKDIVVGLEVPMTGLKDAGVSAAERVQRVSTGARRLLREVEAG